MGEPLYGFQTPNGYSDTAESWVNTGGLLERLNFGLALASNRIPGTRVDLKRFVGDVGSGQPADKATVMDRFLNVIVASEISPKTRETLLKQLDKEAAITTSQRAAVEMPNVSDDAPGNVTGEMPGDAAPQRGRRLTRTDASITDPATKIVGLILGSPEFQRQ